MWVNPRSFVSFFTLWFKLLSTTSVEIYYYYDYNNYLSFTDGTTRLIFEKVLLGLS